MKKIIILFSLALTTFLTAATLQSDKNSYVDDDTVKITFSKMTGQNKDWIGIYPANASNAWGNVIAWQWTGDKASGTKNFNNLPIGNYEARAFYNNSFKAEARHKFTVNDELGVKPTLGMFMSKRSPIDGQELENKVLVIDYYKISENSMKKDWIGIYKKGTSNAWGNVIKWKWVKDLKRFNPPEVGASIYFLPNIEKGAFNLPAGKYEVRLFRHNSFTLHSKVDLTIGSVTFQYSGHKAMKLTYKAGRKIHKLDWIALYEKNKSNAWQNVIKWAWVKDLKENEFDANDVNFPDLMNENSPEYEIRFFRNNSFNLDTATSFSPIWDF